MSADACTCRAQPLAALCALGMLSAACGVRARSEAAPTPAPAAAPSVPPPFTPGATPFRGPTPLGLDAYIPVPDENPLAQERVELGRFLFYDPILSQDSSIACASCHRAELAFSDSVPVSPGVGGAHGARNTPTLVNRAYGRAFFWDGRALSLEATVLQPIENPKELNLPLPRAVARLEASATYRTLFLRAFAATPPIHEAATAEARRDGYRDPPPAGVASGGDPPTAYVSATTLAYALASFVRTIRFGDAPVDHYLTGRKEALSPEAERGRRLFLGKANCSACHAGPNLTDEGFHNTGVSWGSGDPGRYTVTGEEEDRGRFKTPTLREVARTAPYMHDGSKPTLDDVVEFYDRGANPNPNLDPEIRPLGLTAAEKRELLELLRSLGGHASDQSPRPGRP